jgi:hypothetical protein
MSNQHISQFLDYYCDNEKFKNPQYAVLLKGKWGSGKTHFINEYKDKLEKHAQRYIYVSLYGVRNYDEIETKFLETIHRWLYNKKTIFAGKIAKQLLKGTLKIDLDADGKADGNVSVQIPNFKPEDLLNTKDYILIFDDLERCSINIIDLLGYINHFIEHQSYKVILIANEEELEKTEKYALIKEKLIGKTFEFISDASSAYDSFLTELENEKDVKENILQKYKNKILEIFKKSQCNNLRILRQGLFDFERLYDLVFINHISKDKLIDEIINVFFILIFEIKSEEFCNFNKLKNDKHKAWDKVFVKSFNYKKIEDENIEEEKTVYEIILSKYDFLLEDNMILSIETWQEIIENSYIDIDKIDSELNESKYYINENSLSWKRLWNYMNLDDSNFDEVITDVYNNLKDCKYDDLFQVMLISSKILELKNLNLIIWNIENIFDVLKKQIDFLFKNKKIDESLILNKRFTIHSHGYNGLPFKIDFKEYLEIKNYIEQKIDEEEIILYKKLLNKIKDTLENNPSELISLIGNQNAEKPIFKYISSSELYELLINTSNDGEYYFGESLEKRYEHDSYTSKLVDEYDFIVQLKKLLEREAKRKEGKISAYRLKSNLIEPLEKAIIDLKSYREKTICNLSS